MENLNTYICLTLNLDFFHHNEEESAPFRHDLAAAGCPRMGRACPQSRSPVPRGLWTQNSCRKRRAQSPRSRLLLSQPALLQTTAGTVPATVTSVRRTSCTSWHMVMAESHRQSTHRGSLSPPTPCLCHLCLLFNLVF